MPTCTASSAPNICVSPGPSQAKGEADYTALPDTELAAIVRGREAFALYGWKPYMHNPRLKRWLHRIDRPTLLLWGAQDGIVTPSYGDGLRQEIPDARIDIIPGCVHGASDLEQSAGGDTVDHVRREYWQRDAVPAILYSRKVSAPGDEIVLAPRRV